MDNTSEDISLGDVVKYMNYGNKLTDGVVERILRPDILFVTDTKTQYEEKIYKSNIIINITILEKSIINKLSEIHNLDYNSKVIITINENTLKIMNIVEKLKDDNNKLKKKVEDIEFQNIIDENISHFFFFILIILLFAIYYSMYTTEFNKFGLNFYNYSIIYYNKLQIYLLSQFIEYKKIMNDIHNHYHHNHNNSYNDYEF